MQSVKHQTIKPDKKEEIADLEISYRAHYGRHIAAAIIIVLVLGFFNALTNAQIEWSYTWKFLFSPTVFKGLFFTLVMTVVAMSLGLGLGVIFAIMRISQNPVLKTIAAGYIFIFRGIPQLVQLLIWYNLALIFPTIGLPGLFGWNTVDLMTPFVATMFGLGIAQGAYTAEVVRGGLLSVDHGQFDAARALGMTQIHMLKRIVIPQAMRVIIPPIGNEVISMVKLTSLASIIEFTELLHNVQIIYYANARVMELLCVASIWYLIVIAILSVIQVRIEHYFGRGASEVRATI